MSQEISTKKTRKPVDYQNGKIYVIVNSINDKIYIGSCSTELRIRFNAHKCDAKNKQSRVSPLFYQTFKDNLDCFKIIFIENFPCNSKTELEKREYEIIQEKIKELGREKIYNIQISICGEGHPCFGKPSTMLGKKQSDDAKQKISLKMKGRVASEETKKKMSENNKGEQHPFFGKHHTEDSKRKISEENKGKNVGNKNPMFKRGHICKRNAYDNNKVYTYWYFVWSEYNEKTKTSHKRTKTFSVYKYGEEEAYRMCKKFQKTIHPELTENENQNEN